MPTLVITNSNASNITVPIRDEFVIGIPPSSTQSYDLTDVDMEMVISLLLPLAGVTFAVHQITVPGATTSIGGYDTIQDEGSPLVKRAILNFIGAGVTAVDNPGSSSTDITIGGGGGGGGSPGGIPGQVQFNSAGSFGGDAGLTYVPGTDTLTSVNLVVTTALTMPNATVTFAKIQNAVASSKIVGSGASGIGLPYAELALGTNLSMSGATLNAASTNPGGTDTYVQFNDAGAFGGVASFAFNKVTGTITVSNAVVTTALTMPNSTVTLAKIQNAVASSKLLGSGASGSGAPYAELNLGTNLSMTGTTLNAASTSTNLTYTASPTDGTVFSDTGTDATIPLATGVNAGLESPAQFTKLAGIATGATVNTPFHAWAANEALMPAVDPAAPVIRNDHFLMAFSDSVIQALIFEGVVHLEYAGASLIFNVDWAAETAVVGNVTWGVEVERLAPGGQDLDSNGFASIVNASATTTSGTSGVLSRTTWTLTQAQADGITAGDGFRVRLTRRAGFDTLIGNAQFRSISITN